MSEWWTYTLTDFLLFSPRIYYRLFALTNAEVWPLQIVTLALGAVVLTLILRPVAWSGRAVAAILAALWLLVAWAYHWERFDPINWAARYYALGFALQAALLVWTGVVRSRLRFDIGGIPAKIGLALLIYALALHPFVPLAVGRPLAQAEIFGLAPDPTAIATLGVLLATARPRWHLLALPLLWCIVSSLTLWTMEQPEAFLMGAILLPAVAAALRRPPGAARTHP